MESSAQQPSVSKSRLWAGYIIGFLPLLLLAFSGVMKLMKPAPVLEGFARYGFPEPLIAVIGIIQLVCCLIYVVPRTSVLGAILLTGYLGGATVTNLRIGDHSYFMTVLLGIMLWGGLYFRDRRVSALIPLRS